MRAHWPIGVDVGFTLAQCNRYCLSAVVCPQPMEASHEKFASFFRGYLASLPPSCCIRSALTVFAQDEPKRPTNPGLVPNTGQINTGVAQQASSQSTEVDNIPAPRSGVGCARPAHFPAAVGWRRRADTTGTGGQQPPAQRASRVAKRRRRPAGNHHRRLGARFEFGRVRSTVHFCKDNRSATSGEPPPSGPIGSVGRNYPGQVLQAQ